MLSGAAAMPSVPVSYVWLMLTLCAELGVARAPLLQGLDITDDTLNDPDGRVSLRPTYAELCRRALALTGEPGLGYEFGLRAALTSHGIVGYGLMSQPSLRQVLTFGQQFGSVLRLSAWDVHVTIGDTHVRMWAVDSMPPTTSVSSRHRCWWSALSPCSVNCCRRAVRPWCWALTFLSPPATRGTPAACPPAGSARPSMRSGCRCATWTALAHG